MRTTKRAGERAKIYSIETDHRRAIESQLLALSGLAANGEIRGVTYAISDGTGSLKVGSMGVHSLDKDKAIAALFRCTVALVMTA